ncbi:hypothetical protein GCM10010428_01950 [Actinosynnema pretiosum subsp. pretiosum]
MHQVSRGHGWDVVALGRVDQRQDEVEPGKAVEDHRGAPGFSAIRGRRYRIRGGFPPDRRAVIRAGDPERAGLGLLPERGEVERRFRVGAAPPRTA